MIIAQAKQCNKYIFITIKNIPRKSFILKTIGLKTTGFYFKHRIEMEARIGIEPMWTVLQTAA